MFIKQRPFGPHEQPLMARYTHQKTSKLSPNLALKISQKTSYSPLWLTSVSNTDHIVKKTGSFFHQVINHQKKKKITKLHCLEIHFSLTKQLAFFLKLRSTCENVVWFCKLRWQIEYTVHTLQNPKRGRGHITAELLRACLGWPASFYCSHTWGFLLKGIKGWSADMAIFFNIVIGDAFE